MAVSVDTGGGTPRLKIKMDPAYGEKWVPYVSGSGTKTLAFEYRVALPNESPRGIAVLVNSLELNGGTIRSVATQADQPVANPGVVHDAAHKVDSRVDVCRRTSQVRDALVKEISKPCGEITQRDLASHNLLWLELEEKGITSLKAGDFYGLEQIRNLYLDGNSLTTLPTNAVASLTNLENLDLSQNDIRTLPRSIFSGLSKLEYLYLDHNDPGYGTVHSGLFDGLAALKHLTLHYNAYLSLPDGISSKLTTSLKIVMASVPSDAERKSLGIQQGVVVEQKAQ